MLIKKILISILFCLLVSSCSSNESSSSVAQQEAQIRIVDINGNYRPIRRQVPALNSELLQQQQNQNLAQSYDSTSTEVVTPPTAERTNAIDEELGPSREPLIETGRNTIGQVEQEVEYDLGEEETTQTSAVTKPEKIFRTKQDKSLKGTFIQIGSYGVKSGAQITLSKGEKISNAFLKEVRSDGKTRYKILLGPVKNQNEGHELLKKARSNGFKDAFITQIK